MSESAQSGVVASVAGSTPLLVVLAVGLVTGSWLGMPLAQSFGVSSGLLIGVATTILPASKVNGRWLVRNTVLCALSAFGVVWGFWLLIHMLGSGVR
jgi:hypothetical protein